MSNPKPKRLAKPKHALRFCVCKAAIADAKLAELNAQNPHPHTEWKQDKTSARAAKMAEDGNVHLCQFPTKKAKKANDTDDKKDD